MHLENHRGIQANAAEFAVTLSRLLENVSGPSTIESHISSLVFKYDQSYWGPTPRDAVSGENWDSVCVTHLPMYSTRFNN